MRLSVDLFPPKYQMRSLRSSDPRLGDALSVLPYFVLTAVETGALVWCSSGRTIAGAQVNQFRPVLAIHDQRDAAVVARHP